jgi:hypothetical protein
MIEQLALFDEPFEERSAEDRARARAPEGHGAATSPGARRLLRRLVADGLDRRAYGSAARLVAELDGERVGDED